MSATAKRTRLYDYHLSSGAKIGSFGGYDMPLWYKTGPKKEHLVVIESAGIFDTSHMAVVTVTGRDAFTLLQKCHSKDLNACIGPKKMPLQTGKCVYGVFLNDRGWVIDDSIVYMIDEGFFMVIVNAGMGASIASHLTEQKESLEVSITDYTDQLGKFDVQGPAAARLIAKLIKNADAVLDKLPYFNFKGYFDSSSSISSPVLLEDDTPILLSRTGYTGEFGFEILVEGAEAISFWHRLLEAGEEFGALTCGLAARDSLRAGAVLPLSHQDIGDWPFLNHPWPFALPYTDDQAGFTKPFIGGQALLSSDFSEHTYAFAGFDPRKVIPGDDTWVEDSNGNRIGVVMTCATDMAIDRHEDTIYSIASEDRPQISFKGLCCGFIRTTQVLQERDSVFLNGNNRKLEVEIRSDIRPARTARKAMHKML